MYLFHDPVKGNVKIIGSVFQNEASEKGGRQYIEVRPNNFFSSASQAFL